MTTDPDTPKLLTISDGLWVRQEIDNMAWVDLGDCALVVDALEHAEKEAEVFDALAATLGDKPVRYLVNTHTHYDHVALNRAFQRRCHAEILNHETAPLPPEGRWLEGSARRAQLLHMPGCHTPEDWVVWVPEDRVLFVGDIFGWGLIPLVVNLRKDSARLLLDTYQRLIDFDAAVVVGGHGPLLDTDTLRRWVEYFHWACDGAARGVARGKSDAEIAADLAAPQDMHGWWRFLQWKHEDTISKIIKSTRNGWL